MSYPGFPNATHYSPNFSRAELNCHCGCKPGAIVEENLIITAHNLEQLRIFRGRPVRVNDGHRCVTENARVGGVPDSQHVLGKAADIDADGTNTGVDDLARTALGVPGYLHGGIGKYYEGHGLFVHLDWRDVAARWWEPS